MISSSGEKKREREKVQKNLETGFALLEKTSGRIDGFTSF